MPLIKNSLDPVINKDFEELISIIKNKPSNLNSLLDIYSFIQTKQFVFNSPEDCEDFFTYIFKRIEETLPALENSIIHYGDYLNLNYICLLFVKIYPNYEISCIKNKEEEKLNGPGGIFKTNLCSEILIPNRHDTQRIEVMRAFLRASLKYVEEPGREKLKKTCLEFYENYFSNYLTQELKEALKSPAPSQFMMPTVHAIDEVIKFASIVKVYNELDIKAINPDKFNVLFGSSAFITPAKTYIIQPAFAKYIASFCPSIKLPKNLDRRSLKALENNIDYSFNLSLGSKEELEKFLLNQNVKEINEDLNKNKLDIKQKI